MIIRFISKFFIFAIVLTTLSSCAEEEQGRILSYEKGIYLGKKDQSLSDDQLRKLMSRSHIQRVY